MRAAGRALPKALPLRIWLVVLIVAVSAAGLVSTALAVNAVMREFIYDQVDKDLAAAARGWARDEQLLGDTITMLPPTDYSVIRFKMDGSISYFNVDPDNVPKVDNLIIDGRPQSVRSVSASADGAGDAEWRALATEVNNNVIVVAKKIKRENSQLSRLATFQIFTSLCVLLIIGIVGAGVISRALRPLREVERTAAEIAAGDLDKRVPTWPEHTEVGQLSKALNQMLGQLQDSVESARDKEEQMRRFVGDASHELRTPLTSLRGYAELYRSGATQDVDRVFDKIDAESTRMSLLVEDLLALTRAEGSRLELRTVDVLELALAVGSSARAAFPGRAVNVRNKSKSIPRVKGDPDRLHQVLLNLVTNGLRHGGEDATVCIDLRREPGLVCIDVVDDGKGMPQDVADHIFERFYRADSSRNRDTGGSGLGLAITKSLVEQHGGAIQVHSREGEGTTFTVTLPGCPDDE